MSRTRVHAALFVTILVTFACVIVFAYRLPWLWLENWSFDHWVVTLACKLALAPGVFSAFAVAMIFQHPSLHNAVDSLAPLVAIVSWLFYVWIYAWFVRLIARWRNPSHRQPSSG